MNKCNDCKPKPCGCEEASVCGCDIKLDLLCAFYSGVDLQPLGITAGMDGNTVIKIINDYIKNVLDELDLDPTVIQSVGNGAKVYKGLSSEYRHEIKSILEGEGVIVTEQDNTITISFDSSVIPPQEPTVVENIGSGVTLSTEIEAGKEYGIKSLTSSDNTVNIINNGTTVDFKVPLSGLQGIGQGVDIYAGNTGTIGNIRRIKDSNTILATVDTDGSLILEAPQSPDDSIKQYYINENYTGGGSTYQGNGSILKPYKKYTYALRDIIGNGTAVSPQYPNSIIILLSNVAVIQVDLDLVPKLNNRLSVNNTITISNGDSKYRILYSGSSSFNFPFDTTSLCEQDLAINGGGISGVSLSQNIMLTYRNVALISSTTSGVIRGWAYDGHNNFNGTEKTSGITLDRVSYYSSYRTEDSNIYKPLFDKNGDPVLLYSNPVLGETLQPTNSPHMYLYGFGNNGAGNFFINDLAMNALCSAAIKLERTTCSFNGISTIEMNPLRIPVQNLTPSNPGEYLPKLNNSMIENDSAWFRFEELNLKFTYPNAIIDKDGNTINKEIGGYNSLFLFKKTHIDSNQYSAQIGKGQVLICLLNYLAVIDTTNGNPSMVFNNMDYANVKTEIGLLTRSAGTTKPTIIVTGSKFNNVKSDSISNVKIEASDAIINGNQFRSLQSFSDDSSAKNLGGLIVGNIYYNSTIGAMKQIQS